MFNHILLAVDGSEHSLNAAQTASQLARSMNSADLRIVVVYDSVPPLLGDPDFQVILNARLDETEKILQSAVKTVGEVSSTVSTETIAGDPAEAIIKIAETRKCDLIVMGSRGLGRLAGLVLGSVSQKVVSHAPCPVLIVR
ncbi:MAG: Stress response protein NhaX [Anaerolineales bacterium]|nr:Stress response protein NhaX [Anaerolineales bacterium]